MERIDGRPWILPEKSEPDLEKLAELTTEEDS